jgi:AcrR family transcriptional regulator
LKTTKDIILRTSFKSFLEHGFDKISLNEVISKTNLTKGAFYYYFKSKDDLLKSVRERYLENYIQRRIDDISANDTNFLDQLKYIGDSMVKLPYIVSQEEEIEVDPRNYFLLFKTSVKQNEELTRLNYQQAKSSLKIIASIIEKAQLKKQITDKIEADKIASIIYYSIAGIQHEWSINNEIDLKKEIDNYVNNIYRLLSI